MRDRGDLPGRRRRIDQRHHSRSELVPRRPLDRALRSGGLRRRVLEAVAVLQKPRRRPADRGECDERDERGHGHPAWRAEREAGDSGEHLASSGE
jgi:hypothetical protein